MKDHTPPAAKIGASQQPTMPYDYDAALNMHLLGPGEPALSEWRARGLRLPDMNAVRAYRLARVRAALREREIAAAVLFDPLNIRYATDATNMQLWITHNAARYCFIAAEGPAIIFDYSGCEHLSAHNALIDEVRPATSWFYFSGGTEVDNRAHQWAAEIIDLLRASGGMRVAIDRINPEGAHYLQQAGAEIVDGGEVMENARLIKCADEITAMRCAIAACDSSLEVMRQHAQPGISENRLWSYLHAENIARGGEWIETRLLAAGPRTNPWFQESSSRPIQAGELLAFDTDLIGAYGICVDTSRTWLIGADKPSPAQQDLYQRALEQVRYNTALLRPGISWSDLSARSQVYSPETHRHYSCLYHGVGLCDEYPQLPFPPQSMKGFDGGVMAGMTLCVESFVGRCDGGEGVKYEEQVLITDSGVELLSQYSESLIIT